MGAAAVAPLVKARKKEGAFESMEQMCQSPELAGVGKKAMESLIKAGAFDRFGDRNGMLQVIDRILALAQSESDRQSSQQTSMFDMMADAMPEVMPNIDIPDESTTDVEKRQWEQDLLGVSTSSNAMLDLLARRGAKSNEIIAMKDIDADMAGRRVKVTGVVSDVSRRYTRDQRPFAIASLTLMDGAIEVFVWDDKVQQTEGVWQDGKLVAVTASVRVRDDQVSLSCIDAQEIEIPATAAAQTAAAPIAKPAAAESATPSTPSAPAAAEPIAPPSANGNGYASAEPAPEYPSASDTPDLPKVADASAAAYAPDTAVPAAEPPHTNGSAAHLPSEPSQAAADAYDDPPPAAEPAKSALPQSGVSVPPAAANGNGANGAVLPSSELNGNGSTYANGGPTERLTLRLRETSPDRDRRMLFDVKNLLMDYSGECEVTLEIATAGHIVEMEWPMVKVDAGPNLVEQLQRLIGASGEARIHAE